MRTFTKAILVLAVALCTAFTASAQITKKAFSFSYGRWNSYTKEWVWDIDAMPTNFTVEIYDKAVYFRNKGQQSFRFTEAAREDDDETSHVVSCGAIDQDGVECRFFICHFKRTGVNILTAIYNNHCVKWEIVEP